MSDVNIEFCHIYADQLATGDFQFLMPGVEATVKLLRILDEQHKEYSLNILVDNYFSHNKYDIIKLMNFLDLQGLHPDGVYLEGDFVTVCDSFISALKPTTIIHGGSELIFVSLTDDVHLGRSVGTETLKSAFLRGAEIKNRQSDGNGVSGSTDRGRYQRTARTVLAQYNAGNTRYSCPLLASCWTLARLGVSPYVDAITTFLSEEQKQKFVAKELITILPLGYIGVEAIVHELIGCLKGKSLRHKRKQITYHFHTL